MSYTGRQKKGYTNNVTGISTCHTLVDKRKVTNNVTGISTCHTLVDKRKVILIMSQA